ncbi:YeiH family protein [Metallumcola ferriviriculae]|uniref:YeiH family protein n=1 Tax=Metallumcola ferriviriculae TaxID=3039180 RepID=A0AAU0UHV6_9FIRM|nr:YeiH family protein [Desulfitibacteraceae bacterium MK1]
MTEDKAKDDTLKGLSLTLIVAVIAYILGSNYEIIGGPVFAIILGMLYSNIWVLKEKYGPGVNFAAKKILQWSIIVLGASLSVQQVWRTGRDSVSVMLITLITAFIVALVLGRFLNVSPNLTSLIGVGTAICGGSAIAAISPIIKAKDDEIAYSVSTIFFFNIIAVLIFPSLGHLMGLSASAFGLWAGTAINDTSSVVAAGYAFSKAAGDYATVVKLTRTTMIIPIALIFAVIGAAGRKGSGVKVPWKQVFPWFIIWFLAASMLNTFGIIPAKTVPFAHKLAKFMIVTALAAVGLKADFRKMLSTGIKPMLLGMIVWFSVAVTSILVQLILGKI